jgi:hypothetical protein
MGKFGKHIPSFGQQIVYGSAILAAGSLTGLLIANGISGNSTARWLDVYGVDISSTDTTPQTITLSDGANTVQWVCASPTPISTGGVTPYRFRTGAPLYCSASAGTSGKQMSVVVRGVLSST